jgi:large subunit ribosomal protein L10
VFVLSGEHPFDFREEVRVENPRPEKVAVVDEVRERFANADATVLTEYRGLNVPAMAKLRNDLRDAGGEVKIYKNTLVRFAARELGIDIDDLLTGPTAIAFARRRDDGSPGDAVGVAKALKRYATDNDKLVIKGGLLGTKRLSVDEVRALADVAPREQLLAEIAGLFAAPMQQFASLLDAVPRNFVYALDALIDKMGGAPAPADDAPVVEAAEAETQVVEAAEAETPVVEAAEAETPAVEAAEAETPAVEAAEAETPAVEAAEGQ